MFQKSLECLHKYKEFTFYTEGPFTIGCAENQLMEALSLSLTISFYLIQFDFWIPILGNQT